MPVFFFALASKKKKKKSFSSSYLQNILLFRCIHNKTDKYTVLRLSSISCNHWAFICPYLNVWAARCTNFMNGNQWLTKGINWVIRSNMHTQKARNITIMWQNDEVQFPVMCTIPIVCRLSTISTLSQICPLLQRCTVFRHELPSGSCPQMLKLSITHHSGMDLWYLSTKTSAVPSKQTCGWQTRAQCSFKDIAQ